jgi:hypothetical protein
MPYKIIGNKIIKKKTNQVVGQSSKPKKYLKVLNAVEHGWRPPKKNGK